MDNSSSVQPFASPDDNPTTRVERQVEVNARSRTKTDVMITLEPGASLTVSIKQQNADGKPVSLERKTFTSPFEPSPGFKSTNEPETQPFVSQSAPNPYPEVIPKNKFSWQGLLITLALLVYLASRFIGLDHYPIYFFTDEAVQTVLAADLVRDNFKDYRGEVLPTYFVNGGQYNLGTSVYAQILPWLMFGKSIWATRGTSVLISLLAALAVALILKNHIKSKYAFAGVLLLSITPAWFLHSRTAFEVVIAVSFYAAFLYTYMQYRDGKPKYLYAAVIFGALCFYSYSPAQMVMAVTAVALLLTDIRTHLKNWKTILIGLGVACVLAIPYLRFMILHPDENLRHLQILDSYWIQNIPLSEKLGKYFGEYLKMLNPFFWFLPNNIDLERHVMKDYGHLLRWTLPFFALGFGLAAWRIKKPQYRVFLISLLAAPAGAALAGAAVTRGLFMVIPAVVLTAIGLDQVLLWIEKAKVPKVVLVCLVGLGLTTFNGFMVRDALVNGPLWFSNYSLGGQQYGALQVFGEIKNMLKKNPNQKIFLSPSWANGTDVLARFFFNDPMPFDMGSVDSYMYEKHEIQPGQVFILIPQEYENAKASEKFKTIDIIKTIDYPDGEPGFYFVRLEYVDDIDQILAQEEAARRKLSEIEVTDPAGNKLTIAYPQLDMGSIENLFDGDGNSMVRTLESNPMILQIKPAEAVELKQIVLRIGGTATTFEILVTPSNGEEPIRLSKQVPESNEIRDVIFDLEQPTQAAEISISILNTHDSDRAHVHAWEVSLH